MKTTANESQLSRMLEGIGRVLVGKEETVLRATATLLARGHLLIEDVPGIGKTLLGLALARSIDADFRRIQFTNDLMPSDVLGLNVYSPKEGRFDFRPGPIFSRIILADEINRSTPKTQSALLEAMSERQVSIEGTTHPLPEPFFVIATENPIEYHGTFPLPEAQLDRFLMRVRIGYPSGLDERDILRGGDIADRLQALAPAMSCEDLLRLQEEVERVHAEDSILDYIVSIAKATRENPRVRLGLSPRGSLGLCRAAKAFARISGRDYCVPDDVKRAAAPVVAHRLALTGDSGNANRAQEAEAFVDNLLSSLPAPA